MISGSRLAVSGVSSAGFSTTVQPGSQARRDLPRGQHERHVPRGDQPGDALGPANDVADLGRCAERVLVHRAADLGEVAEVLGGACRQAVRLGDRQARCRTTRTAPDGRRAPRSRRRSPAGRVDRWRADSPTHSLWSKACRADATARSTSAAPPAASVQYCSWVTGSLTAIVAPSTLSTCSPLM